jgi:nucleoid DNA-binding protein
MAKGAKPAAKKAAGKKAMTKSGLVAHLAEKAEISKKQADAVVALLEKTIIAEVKGAGKFVLPGVCRVTVTHKPAVAGGEKKINRLTGAEYITKPKPAHNVVKLRAVKALKDALK